MGFETKEGIKLFLQKLLKKISQSFTSLREFFSLPFIFGAWGTFVALQLCFQ
jgi:hypothetical protein